MKLFRMKIEFKQPHLSITEFDPIESNINFMILTGKNGSGKTQLLEALDNGSAQIDSIKPTQTVYFNYTDFKIENEREYNQQALMQELEKAWDLFTKNRNNLIIQQSLKNIKRKTLQPEEQEKLKKIAKEKTKPLFSLNKYDIGENKLYEKFCNYKNEIENFFSRDAIQNQPANNLQTLLKITDFPDEITQAEFKKMYTPTNLKKNFLPSSIGKIFLRYRIKEYEEFMERVDKADNVYADRLRKQCTDDFLKKNGGMAPWDFINSILKTYSGFDYTISFPNKFDFDRYSYQQTSSFIPKLKNERKDIQIDYQSMSSGEHTLFALALCLFKTSSDNLFPKLLLLDEVDSSLHPSMIENLFRVITDVFVQNGTKVMLTTHSPTTIALAEEKSIFVVNKEGRNRIEKTSKNKALEILTENLATIDQGLKLFDQISKKELSIISEGNNIEYIKKAIELFSTNDAPKIDLLAGFEHKSGKSQLKTLFGFFAIAKPDKKVLFVWDSDFTTNFEEKNNTYGFVFEKNLSSKVERSTGIESLFNDEYVEGFVSKTTNSSGEITGLHFEGNKKQEFKNHILLNGDTEIFKNFQPLIQKINELLAKDQTS